MYLYIFIYIYITYIWPLSSEAGPSRTRTGRSFISGDYDDESLGNDWRQSAMKIPSTTSSPL